VKLILSIMSLILSSIVTIWSMQSGWGLTAQSWPVIIWAIVFQLTLMMVQVVVMNKDGK
jgi:hypothetical protein